MKRTHPVDGEPRASWLHKAKVAFAAFAFVAAGVFGISAAEAPQAQETAQDFSYDSYLVIDEPEEDPTPVLKPIKDPRGGGIYSMRSGSWS